LIFASAPHRSLVVPAAIRNAVRFAATRKISCARSKAFYPSAMDHSPAFLKIVKEAQPRVRELTLEQAQQALKVNPKALLVDVREDSEWQNGHAENAVHIGKGVFERDLEKKVPDPDTPLLMYCGGGYRSILTADVAQKMGYKQAFSIIGGYKSMMTNNWPMVK
jgi:rhodanese-related sulfurtransferase